MPFNTKYVAWLDGQSVAVGGLKEVKKKAIEIFQSPLWQETAGNTANLKITTYGKQQFVTSLILKQASNK